MAKSRKAERKSRKSERKERKDRKTRKQEGGKRKASPWIKFVMKVKAQNPKMDFGEVLKKASKMKKEGKADF
jgi:hypothetical protein